MNDIPYDDWRSKAAREISDALCKENRRVAYYAAGGGDGWARSYGAGNFRSPNYAAIIDKHYQASLVEPLGAPFELCVIDAPAKCVQCGLVITSPTTGKLLNRCSCGSELKTTKA